MKLADALAIYEGRAPALSPWVGDWVTERLAQLVRAEPERLYDNSYQCGRTIEAVLRSELDQAGLDAGLRRFAGRQRPRGLKWVLDVHIGNHTLTQVTAEQCGLTVFRLAIERQRYRCRTWKRVVPIIGYGGQSIYWAGVRPLAATAGLTDIQMLALMACFGRKRALECVDQEYQLLAQELWENA